MDPELVPGCLFQVQGRLNGQKTRQNRKQGNVRGTSRLRDAHTGRARCDQLLLQLLSSCLKGQDKKPEQNGDISPACHGWFLLCCLRGFCGLCGFVQFEELGFSFPMGASCFFLPVPIPSAQWQWLSQLCPAAVMCPCLLFLGQGLREEAARPGADVRCAQLCRQGAPVQQRCHQHSCR